MALACEYLGGSPGSSPHNGFIHAWFVFGFILVFQCRWVFPWSRVV